MQVFSYTLFSVNFFFIGDFQCRPTRAYPLKINFVAGQIKLPPVSISCISLDDFTHR
jgi:hypothetical protein